MQKQHIEELRSMFHLLGDAGRLQIILACMEKPQQVSDLVRMIGSSQPLVSHHLRLLKEARLLKANKQGRNVFYILSDAHIRCVLEDMIEHVKHD